MLEFDASRLGNKIRHKMKHPEYLLFADEVGSNTNGEKDKTVSEKRLCHKEDRPHQVSSSSDHHYTSLGFTNRLGQTVCCFVVLAGEPNSILDFLGGDVINLGEYYLIEQCTDDNALIKLLEANMDGHDKIFPGGSSCRVEDYIVPPFVTYSSTLVLDGHGSRFSIEFLQYINPKQKR